MSADNGVYIAEFPDGYRVAYGMAIENIEYYPKNSIDRKATLKEYFGDSVVHTNLNDALVEAEKIEKKFGPTEYGVCTLKNTYENFT